MAKNKSEKKVSTWLDELLKYATRKELLIIARRYHIPRANSLKKINTLSPGDKF